MLVECLGHRLRHRDDKRAAGDRLRRRISGETWAFHDLLFAGPGGLLVCGFLTPVIFAVAKRWPFAGPHMASRVLLHLVSALVFWIIAGICVALGLGIFYVG